MKTTTAKTGRPLLLLFFFSLLAIGFFMSLSPVYAETTTTTTVTGENPVVTVTTTVNKEGNITTTTVTTKEEKTTYEKKKFSILSQKEKTDVLNDLIKQGLVKQFITVEGAGKQYLSTSVWQNEGIISYGQTYLVNAAVSATSHSNYDEETGQYRYWGYDINGGLYANDEFPRDSDSGKAPYKKNWLTQDQILKRTIAIGYIGKYTMNLGFLQADKTATANLFLTQNPAWGSYGITAPYILNHFYFNSVISATGYTQGQFIGVHRSTYNNQLYYQSFAVKQDQIQWPVPTTKTTTSTTTTITDSGGTPITTDSGIVVVDPDPTISAIASLSLPKTTYVGHLALARDCSMYDVEGVSYSAARAYEEGLADNDFDAPDATLRRVNKTQSTVSYNEQGTYDVTLQAIPNGGATAEDTQSITVLPTPNIIATLTGTQKENRKQVLNIKVARSPTDPLTTLTVKLEHLTDSGTVDETVTLVHNLGTGANTLSNSATIKTRAIEAQASDMYFTNCKLEFLTKNKNTTEYRYTIYAKAKGGETDTELAKFTVEPDHPPVADIEISSSFVREKNSNIAELSMTDATTTDGDQVTRTWQYRAIKAGQTEEQKGTWTTANMLAGYNDQSFGSGKVIGFQKTGVGPFEIKLLAKDNWTEETLSEYITEADYLTDSAIAESQIINVAPIVSLSPISPRTAEITILAGGKSEYETAKANQALIEQTMLQNGVDAKIKVEQMQPIAKATAGKTVPAIMTGISTPLSYQGEWSVYESANFIIDDKCFYKIDASWPDMSWQGYPQSPYTVTCWDTETKAVKWKYTFTDAVFGVASALSSGSGGSGADLLSQDDSGRYLFLSVAGKTLILSKDNGAALTTIPMEVGANVTSTQDSIYALKKDGIYAVSSKTGAIKKVYNGTVVMELDRTNGNRPGCTGCRTLEGKVHFVTARGGLLCRGLFDPETEAFKYEPIGDSIEGVPYSANMSILSIDTAGKIILCRTTPSGSYNTVDITAYGRNNRTVGSTSFSFSAGLTVFPVTNAKGQCNYVAASYRGRNSYCQIELRGLTNGYVYSIGNYPTESSRILFAKEIEGKVYIYSGAYWVYVKDMGFSIYPERTKGYIFDLANPNQSTPATNGEVGIDLGTYEYGVASDTLAVFQTGYNVPGGGQSENLILKWDQTLPMILERYRNKYFSSGANINALVLFDETNTALYTDAILNDLSAALAAKVGRLIQTTREELTGSDLGKKILGLGEEKQNMLGIASGTAASGTKGDGTIQKSYQLKPNTTYYYEYEVKEGVSTSGAATLGKDILTITNDNSGKTPYAEYGNTKYIVRGSLFEDFNDEKLGHGFSEVLNQTKIKEGSLVAEALHAKKYTTQGQSLIKFTIPSGYRGVLSFDWKTNVYNNTNDARTAWQAATVQIDGQTWQQWLATPGAGHYGHPDVLSEGEHTLLVQSLNSSLGLTQTMSIDNLNVDLMLPQPETGDLSQGTQETDRIDVSEGGFNHVAGHFTTSFQTGTYESTTNVKVIQGLSTITPYMEYIPKDYRTNTNQQLNFTIPGDKEASRASFLGSVTMTRPDNSHCHGFTWSTDNYAWYSFVSESRWMPLPPLVGPKSITTSWDNRYGNASIGMVRMLITDAGKSSAATGNGFLGTEGAKMAYFAANNTYKSTKLSFAFPEGNSLLRDLKIYYFDADGEKIYLEEESFASSASLSQWQTTNAKTAIVQEEVPKKDEKSLIYKKGELVAYHTSYFDYETDPSKKQYWKYTHTPMNDGANPDAAAILDEDGNVVSISGKVLNAPLTHFYIDGKYTVEHWQEDDTTRGMIPGGDPAYDKTSNSVFLTFYVEGGGIAPWVESIKTVPGKVMEGEDFAIAVKVKDADLDVLRLTTEVYFAGELIYSEKKTGITAVNGVYPTVTTAKLPDPAETGKYEVVCTVRDWSGVGMGSYRFAVVSEAKITGNVYHTDEWTKNRQRFNLYYFNEAFNQKSVYEEYIKRKLPRERGSNVFWAGERFLLSAEVGGNPETVTAQILEAPSYKATLKKSGEVLWTGTLWEKSMSERFNSNKPEEITVRFTAVYAGGATKTNDVKVIMDNTLRYWLLHRAW